MKKPYFNLALALFAVCLAGAGCTKEFKKARHLSKGDKEFKAQRYDSAEIEYKNVLKNAPMNPVAVGQLGIIYQEEGKLGQARPFLLKAVELEPNNLEVRTKLALNCLSFRDFSNGVAQASFVLAKKPGDPDALEALAGSAIAGSGNNSNAIAQAELQLQKLRQADQDRAAYHVAFGTLALGRQDSTNAESEFKKALELDPKSSSALFALGNIYWTRKDLSAADQAFKSAAELSPLRSAKRLRYVEFQLMNGKMDEGKQALASITKEAPDYIPAWTLLAQVAFGEKRYDDTRAYLQRILARDSSNYEGLMLNGNLRLAKGENDKAVADFNQMATLYPRSPQVQFQLATAYLRKNDVARALGCLDQAVSVDKDFADAILLQANINLRKGDVDQAIFSLNDLIKRQPQLGQAYLLLADAYLAKNDLDSALAVCRRMAEIFPKALDIPMIMGTLLARQGKLPEARQAFEHALELYPDYLPAIEDLVRLDIAEKKFPAAIDRVQKQIDKFPKLAGPWVLMANIYLAQARSTVDAENQRNPGSGKPKLGLADLPAAQPDVEKTEAALQKAIELNPESGEAYVMLANVYTATGKQQQALQRLNGLLSKTNDVAVLMQVGMLNETIKDYAAAKQAYEKVLAVNPNFSTALNNLAYIYSEREQFKDLDKAYQLADQARRLLPNSAATADTLGWILYKRGEFSRALGLLEDASARLPNEPELQFHLGMVHYMLGNEGAARLALQKAAQSPTDFAEKDQAAKRLAILAIDPKTADAPALAALQQHLKDSPDDPVALERLGAVQERDGAFDKAAETYQTALNRNPQDFSLMLKLADLYSSHLNAPDKALALARTAHDMAPDNARVSALLGRLVLQSNDSKPADPKWAASLLEESSRKLPNDPQISYDLAWAYYTVGRVADAQNLMQSVASLGSSFAKADDAKRFLAATAASISPAQASAFNGDAQKILSADSNYLPALVVSAICQEGQGNFQAAADTYSKILARFPLFLPASRNLGLLSFAHLNDDAKAYDLLSKARENLPQDSDVAKALGILTYRKSNWSRAAQLLQEASTMRQNDPELLYYLGMAQYKLQAKPQSKASLQQALASNLAPKLAEDARRVLSELK